MLCYPESVHARVEANMTDNKLPLSTSHLLNEAQTLLTYLLPANEDLTRDEVHALALRAGVWALTAEVQARTLTKELAEKLGELRRPIPLLPAPYLPPLTQTQVTEVEQRAKALGQPWTLGVTVRNSVTQTSYRVYPALIEKARRLFPSQPMLQAYDLQITLALAYLALPELRHRVNGILQLRYANTGQGEPLAKAVAVVLRESGLPWSGRVTLRGPIKQVAMRVTTGLATALKEAPTMGLRCTVADLHTTLLALYIADEKVRAHMHQLVQARASQIDLT